jgi:hypothetical protein
MWSIGSLSHATIKSLLAGCGLQPTIGLERRNWLAANVNLRFQGCAGPVPPCVEPWLGKHPSLVWEAPVPGPESSRLWSGKPSLGSLAREAAVSGLGSTGLWSGKHPSQPLRSTLRCGPRCPLFSLVVRAAAANVNPRTRLSHMTEIPPLLRS